MSSSDQYHVEKETEQKKPVPIILPEEVPDYDDKSGVYLGPGRTFDDEDLEYLNKDVEEQTSVQKSKDDPPPSPLIVDSVSGIYLGFEDKEEDSETEDGDEKTEDSDQEDVSLDTVKRSRMFGLFKRKQSKYKVSTEADLDMEGGHCFKFIRKVWRKAEVCQ